MPECVGGCVGGYVGGYFLMCWWMGLNINLKGYEKDPILLVIIF